jgi:hypothetical protein
MNRPALLTLFALLGLAAPAAAQRTIAQDTMSMSTPVAVTCGFCSMEAYGVVFRELPGGGLTPGDFPLTLRSMSLALGAAEVTGTGASAACRGLAAGGTAVVHVEIYAGTMAPDVDIRTFPAAGTEWTGETLVYAADGVPVTMSTPTTDGAPDFDLQLNTFMVVDDMGNPVTVPAPATYLRAVVVLGDGGTSSLCVAPATAPPGFPVRDDDGVVASHRSFIYASGYGWAWNEAVPGGAIHGDWGIRLNVQPLPHADAGAVDAGASDAGAIDGGAIDGGATDAGAVDAGAPATTSRGCGCSASSPRAPSLGALLFALAVALARYGSKTTRPNRSGTWKSPTSGADQPTPN